VKQKSPSTFAELVQQLQTILQQHGRFESVHDRHNPVVVPFHSIKLTEIRSLGQGKSRKVVLLLDASFKGRFGPHVVHIDKQLLADLSIAEVSIGMGAWTFADGHVEKGMRVNLLPTLPASLEKELAAIVGSTPEIARKTAVASVKKTKAYQKVVERQTQQLAEMQSLKKALALVESKLHRSRAQLIRLEDKAVARATTISASSRRNAPQVVIA